MIRCWVACAGVLLPLLGFACEGDRYRCQKQFSELVAYRTEAIENAFGDLFGALPADINIKFVSSRDPDYERFGGVEAYDRERRAMIIPRRALEARTPNPLRWTAYYWPYYENERYRAEYPVVETVDNLLWSAYLQESARERGLSWPDKDCTSADVGKRLPCEMVVTGVAHLVKELRGPLFNSNRVDRIWPDDFTTFRKRVWRSDQAYLDVQRYGGILLIQPLVDEFGIPRTLAYVAQTPFRIENDNMHTSALRYQERARAALGAGKVRVKTDPWISSNESKRTGVQLPARVRTAVSTLPTAGHSE